MNGRLKELRKSLGLSQKQFGARLGVHDTAISKIESGDNKLTDQMVKLVCKEFGVSHLWLTEGDGEMFAYAEDDVAAAIDKILSGENETAKAVFKAFAKLDESDWLTIQKIIEGLKK